MTTKEQRKKTAFYGGIAGLVIGFWMIFIAKDNFGFLPAVLGVILLIYGRK